VNLLTRQAEGGEAGRLSWTNQKRELSRCRSPLLDAASMTKKFLTTATHLARYSERCKETSKKADKAVSSRTYPQDPGIEPPGDIIVQNR
jgi:hypothetical protein